MVNTLFYLFIRQPLFTRSLLSPGAKILLTHTKVQKIDVHVCRCVCEDMCGGVCERVYDRVPVLTHAPPVAWSNRFTFTHTFTRISTHISHRSSNTLAIMHNNFLYLQAPVSKQYFCPRTGSA